MEAWKSALGESLARVEALLRANVAAAEFRQEDAFCVAAYALAGQLREAPEATEELAAWLLGWAPVGSPHSYSIANPLQARANLMPSFPARGAGTQRG